MQISNGFRKTLIIILVLIVLTILAPILFFILKEVIEGNSFDTGIASLKDMGVDYCIEGKYLDPFVHSYADCRWERTDQSFPNAIAIAEKNGWTSTPATIVEKNGWALTSATFGDTEQFLTKEISGNIFILDVTSGDKVVYDGMVNFPIRLCLNRCPGTF